MTDTIQIKFADPDSEEQFERLFTAQTKPPTGRDRLIIICGDKPGAGKTQLAHFLVAKRYGVTAATSAYPLTERGWDRILEAALSSNRPYLLFNNSGSGDEIFPNTAIDSSTLAAFVTSERWAWRDYRSCTMSEADAKVTIIIAATAPEISEDIRRRATIINILAPEEPAGSSEGKA